MYFRTIPLRSILLFLLAGLCLAAQTTPGTSTITREYIFPPVGLGSGETASITVVNTASSSSTATAIASQPAQAPSCSGTIAFSSANGAIGTPTAFTVGANGFQTVTLAFANAGLGNDRGEIQGKVALNLPAINPAPCALSISLETYDSMSFATHVLMSSPSSFAVSPLPIVTPFQR